MKKSDDVFIKSKEFLDQNTLKEKYDFLVIHLTDHVGHVLVHGGKVAALCLLGK